MNYPIHIKFNTGLNRLGFWHTDIPAIISDLKKAADAGKFIIGVCNGFQILTETGLLPGTLIRNKNLKFISKLTKIQTVNTSTSFTKSAKSELMLPVAHHDGNYFCDAQTLESLKDNDQIAFKYAEDINGSIEQIAGIFNKNKNILGMMPHPERAIDKNVCGTDGLSIFESIIN